MNDAGRELARFRAEWDEAMRFVVQAYVPAPLIGGFERHAHDVAVAKLADRSERWIMAPGRLIHFLTALAVERYGLKPGHHSEGVH